MSSVTRSPAARGAETTAAHDTPAQVASAAGRPAATTSPYANQVITKAPPWKGLTVWDILFNNLSIGTFLAATLGAALAPERFAGLALIAYPLALLLLVVDLGLLIADLGDPLRFHHMLRVFKPGAPMSLGTWSLSGYGVLLGIATAAAVLQWPLLAGVRALLGPVENLAVIGGGLAAALAVIPALGGILYKGVLFSVTAQPGWRDARWLGAYLGNSAMLLGAAVLLVVASLMGRAEAATALRSALLLLLLLDVVYFWLLFRGISPGFRARYGPNQRLCFWLVLVVLGWIAPFFLLLQGSFVELLPPPLIVAGALAVRYAVVFLPYGDARG